MRRPGVLAVLLIDPEAIEATVNPSKYLVSFVDNEEIKRLAR